MRQQRAILAKTATSVGAIFLLSLIVFLFTRLSGDPAALLVPMDASPEELARMRQALGLDKSLPIQFLSYVRNAIHGDFGTSLRYQQPALKLVLSRMPATIELAAASAVIGWAVAVPLGILAAYKRNSLWDRLARFVALFGQSMPVYWLGILLIMFFAVKMHLVPASGRGELAHLVLPATALSLNLMGSVTRVLRVNMIEVLQQNYIRTAIAKGVSRRALLFKHALRNASIAVVTILGLQLGSLLGGAIVTETVFAWPGLGRFVVQAIQFRDFPVVQAGVLVLAALIALISIVIDLVYPLLDSRMRV